MVIDNELTPAEVMRQVSQAIPEALRTNVIIIGSLAAGFHFFGNDKGRAIRTKDVDAMFSPHALAVGVAQEVMEALLSAGWTIRRDGQFGEPGDASTAKDQLPLARLKPPQRSPWFLELMSAPPVAADGALTKDFDRVLALAYLSIGQDRDAMEKWSEFLRDALRARYPQRAESLIAKLDGGLSELLGSREDFEQAVHTCSVGLLQSMDVSPAALEGTGRRLMEEAIGPLKTGAEDRHDWNASVAGASRRG